MQGQTMRWSTKIHFKSSEVKAVGLILAWVLLYFNVYRFDVIQDIGKQVSLPLKLLIFLLFLVVVMFTANGIYKGLLINKPRMISPSWFLADFILSVFFAVGCSDQQILFRVLSVSIYVFDRALYYLQYRKKFKRKRINGNSGITNENVSVPNNDTK
jgi:hypothetical protein